MLRRSMTGAANIALHAGLMRFMASGTSDAAFQKTCALRQIDGLMPHVPRVAPIALERIFGRLAMTGPAQFVHGGACHLRRIAKAYVRSSGMGGARPVTGFALHARLCRFDAKAIAQVQGPGRMALKTFQDRRVGIEDSIALARRTAMPRRDAQFPRRPVVAQSLFKVVLVIHPADKGHGLIAASERPVALNSREPFAQRMLVERKQRPRVAGL